VPEVLCRSCKEPLAPADVRCESCGQDPSGPQGGRRIAVRRAAYDAGSGGVLNGDFGGTDAVDNGSVFASESACDGCDGTLVEVLDGQVVGYSLTHCDEEYCYYESTPGGIV